MLSQISVSVNSGNIAIVGSVHFSALYIFTLYKILLQHTQTLLLKCQPQNIDTVLSTTLGFRIGKKVTDHCSILAPEVIDFSQELLPP